MSEQVVCDDCGRPYGDQHGFPDLIITKEAWRRISPTSDDGGLLCPSCICKRLHVAGMSNVEGAFMSGPIKSVDPSLMHTIRLVENLREQGHGWSCPDCGHGREKCAASNGCEPSALA
jgi:DNA-directed RNA polymerase subunit RPC12/RpoP